MTAKKTKNSFDQYELTVSFLELRAIRDALEADHADPVRDALHASLAWYCDNALPGPGEDQSTLDKAEKEAADAEGPAPGSRSVSADALLPETPETEEDENEPKHELPPERQEPAEDEGGEDAHGADQHIPLPPEE